MIVGRNFRLKKQIIKAKRSIEVDCFVCPFTLPSNGRLDVAADSDPVFARLFDEG